MNTYLYYTLLGVVVLAIWLAIALGVGLLFGRAAHRADEIELGDDEDEGVSPGDFVPPPNRVGNRFPVRSWNPYSAATSSHPLRRTEDMALTWETPPTQKGGRSDRWATEADELRQNPGKWARLTERATAGAAIQFAHHVRTGTLKAFRPRGAFDARSSGKTVWVTYSGRDET